MFMIQLQEEATREERSENTTTHERERGENTTQERERENATTQGGGRLMLMVRHFLTQGKIQEGRQQTTIQREASPMLFNLICVSFKKTRMKDDHLPRDGMKRANPTK